MHTTTTSIRNRTFTASLQPSYAIAAVFLGAAFLAACGPASDTTDAGRTTASPDASVGEPVARDASARTSEAGAGAEAGGGADAGGTSAPADGGTQVPVTNVTCTVAAQCASGFCVDGVCCDTACNGSCQGCAQTGKVGTCSPIKDATDDTCGGDSICDGSGACRKLLGKACVISSDCASGNCVDGVCCGSTGCGTCQSCAIPGSEGTCTPVARFTEDPNSNCSGASLVCDGLGMCRSKNGTACAANTDCASLECVDGVCCNQACDGTCYSCDQQGSVGTCKPLDGAQDPSATVACTGSNICTAPAGAVPACKIKDGEACTSSADCLNGSCITSYRDADKDGYGSDKVSRCERAPAAGYVLTGGDCCDSDAGTHPGVTTYSAGANACGRFDRNCDGKVEEQAGGSAPSCGCISEGIGGKLGGTTLCTACR